MSCSLLENESRRMILTLANRNLVHDRVRLAVTLVGIVFSIVLVAVQLGLYLGAERMIAAILDRAPADLWIMPTGSKSLVDAVPMQGQEKYTALATSGVQSAEPTIITFSDWRIPKGGTTPIVIIGTDPRGGGIVPWNITHGQVADLQMPDAVGVDRSYFADLGVNGLGDTGQIDVYRSKVAVITETIRSFTTAPYVFMPLSRAREILGLPGDAASFILIKVANGAKIEDVRNRLLDQLGPKTYEVLTTAEFRERTLDNWLFATGAGGALIIGAVLGLLVGTVIVAQTLYASTKDHLAEFATLRALGSTTRYIHKVILAQAGTSAVIGYAIALVLSLIIVRSSADTAMPIVMTPLLAMALFGLTVIMCAVSALAAIQKVTRIDPATVFSR